jgi:hypothetical protein
MGSERRDRADQGQTEANPAGKEPRIGPKPKVKSFEIPKRLVFQAWEKVRVNNGAPGVDAVSITEFAAREKDNLYLLWNRMSSGSYFPGPVRAVEIPKDHGAGVRLLGVPNTADRVAQTAAAMLLEEKLEPIFHPDSYGYRPGRSAHDALAVTRKRCWKQAWAVDLDIRAFLDVQINHPVGLPTPVPTHPHRVQRTTTRPIPVRIGMEDLLHSRLQVHGHHRLRNSVRDRGHTEDPDPISTRFRYFHHPHRRREITARREPIPQLEKVPFQVPLKLLDRLLVDARCTPISPDPSISLEDHMLRNIERLRSAHPVPPSKAG